MDQRIAVLMTSHNRREKTLACLRTLQGQRCGAIVETFLVDAGSTDGTPQAVRERFPEVHLIDAAPDLYWSGGMRMADSAAEGMDRAFTLWINDDVQLHADALSRLLDTFEGILGQRGIDPIVVGAFADPDSGETTYSGFLRHGPVRRLRFQIVEPQDRPVRCVTMNGNMVLIPEAVRTRVGGIDATYTHSMGDVDYGLRATAAGAEIWLAPGHVGVCRQNPVEGTFRDDALTASQRLRDAVSLKQLPPREWKHFARRHGGWLWPLLWATPYVRAVLHPSRPRTR